MTPPRPDRKQTRAVHDPFLGKTVEISNRLTDRLRGKYASGPTLPNGEPEFGWRQFETPPIQHEAAGAIDALVTALAELQSAETAYRMVYDLDGYYHQNTLDARAKLRSAGYRARDVLASVGEQR